MKTSTLRSFFNPLVSPQENARQASVIRPVYWIGLAVTGAVCLAQVVATPGQWGPLLPTLFTLAALALVFPLIFGHRERLGGLLIIAASCLINTYAILEHGGMAAGASRTFEVLVVVAGLIMGPRVVVPVTLIGIGAYSLALLGSLQGWVISPYTLAETQVQYLTAVGLLISTAVVVYFAAEALRTRANFNEGVVAALPGVVHIFDLRAGASTWMNRHLSEMLGHDEEPATLKKDVLVSERLAALMHPEDLGAAPAMLKRWDTVPDGQVLISPFRLRHRNGEWRNFESRDTVYKRDEAGRVQQFIGYIEDVTDKRRAEEGMQRTERLQALGQLAGGVAHDFNNLLAPIMGNAELIRSSLPPGHQAVESAESILRSAGRARELTRRMLSLSRSSPLDRRAMELSLTVEAFLPMLRRSLTRDLQLDFQRSDEPLLVLADTGQVERALLNLALNAKDALGGQGRLVVRTSLGDGEAVLHFIDDGPGMSAEVRQRAFEPFFTTKEPGKGTGLGLSGVHSIMAQHSGRVELDSEPGQGTHFRLYFPLHQAPPGGLGAAGPWPGTVLLVDDEADLREVLARMFEHQGWRVLSAATAEQALDQAAAEAGPIQLLVTDVRLPGMRGPELGAMLGARQPGLRTLYISGFADADVPGPLLAKPFDLGQLNVALDALKKGT